MTPAPRIIEASFPMTLASHAPPPDRPAFTDPEALDWYVAEALVHGAFLAEDELRAYGLDAYCPRQTMWRRSGRMKTRTHRPLLGRYLFFGMDHERHNFHRVRTSRGVGRIMGHENGPQRIPYGLVRAIREAETLGTFDATHDPGIVWAKDNRAKVTGGPFKDFMVRLLATPEGRRVKVMFEEIGKGRLGPGPMQIDLAKLEKVND